LLDPIPKAHVYDCTCGSGGLLIKARLVYEEQHADNPSLKNRSPKLYGQELNPTTFALAKMNMFLHDYTDSSILIGDTFRNPRFEAGGKLKQFDYVIANPMWNQDNYTEEFYDNDRFGRFHFGVPPNSSADWGWAQHILASLNDTGRAAVVLDTGAVSRGSGARGSNKEKEIRKAFVEADLIEGVVLLPENLFYNTNAPGIILLLSKHKSKLQKNKVIFLNAAAYCEKQKPKNVLTILGIEVVVKAYKTWKDVPKLCKVVAVENIRTGDYNLSPSQFVETSDEMTHRPLQMILTDLKAAAKTREDADKRLTEVLTKLDLGIGNRV
jgi:type I restriction enzyme M protein